MYHPDEIALAIRDKQVRYHHEAYRRGSGAGLFRRWLGVRLMHVGESLAGPESFPIGRSVAPGER